jgi:hypothetical protein
MSLTPTSMKPPARYRGLCLIYLAKAIINDCLTLGACIKVSGKVTLVWIWQAVFLGFPQAEAWDYKNLVRLRGLNKILQNL